MQYVTNDAAIYFDSFRVVEHIFKEIKKFIGIAIFIKANIEYKRVIHKCVDTFRIGFINLMPNNKRLAYFTNLFSTSNI